MPSYPHGSICWLDAQTPDLVAAQAFYGPLFGWTFADTGPEFGNYHFCSINDAVAAGMTPQQPGDVAPSAWTVYFASDDIAQTATAIAQHGGTVLVEPFAVGHQGQMMLASDPTGAVFGVWQPAAMTGAAVVDTHGAMTWFEVNTGAAQAAVEFYTAVFGLSTQRAEVETVEYHFLKHQDTTVAGVLQMNAQWEGMPAHWMPYFSVNNVDAACALAPTHGGSVAVPAFNLPVGRIAVLADPGGAHFTVVSPLPS
jgi:uncharacterized protein